MSVIINKAQLTGFVIDDQGELKAPKYFEESQEISTQAKSVLKIIAKHCMTNNDPVIPMSTFRDMLEKELPLSIKTVATLLELRTNNYIEINI